MLKHPTSKIGLDRRTALCAVAGDRTPFQNFPAIPERLAAEYPRRANMKKSPQQAALEFAQTSIETRRGEDPVTTSMIVHTVDEVLALPKTLLQTSAVDRDMLIAELEARYSVWIGATVAL